MQLGKSVTGEMYKLSREHIFFHMLDMNFPTHLHNAASEMEDVIINSAVNGIWEQTATIVINDAYEHLMYHLNKDTIYL